MESTAAFALLGLGSEATAEEIRDARRRLAKSHHPDRGGDGNRMRAINEAADAALRAILEVAVGREAERGERHRSAVDRDVPSFTVEALPVETFEALAVVASWLGEILDDDPPYRLDTHLDAPFDCWCRLEVLPDAGASSVSLTVAGVDGDPGPDVLVVRDAWITELNTIDWPSLPGERRPS